MKFKKEIIKGLCIDYSSEGKGIIKDKEKVIFCNGLFLGEEAEVETQFSRANILYGKIKKLEKVSPYRIEPKCKVCTACGGCQFQQLAYEEQLRYKTKKVKEILKRIGKVDVPINDCLACDTPFFYRNKIQLPIRLDKQKRIVSGFYKEKSHEIIPIDKCYIEDERSEKIIKTIKDLMKSFNIRPYDEDLGNGELRHVLIRTSKHKNEIMVVLVMNRETFKGRNNFVKALVKECPEITTVVQNLNKRRTNVILGEKEEILYGPGFIKDTLCGLTFKISAKSFYQVNPLQCEKLYEKAIQLADIKKEDVVLDAYSGIGTIGLIASRQAKKVISVEVVKEAIKDGILNAKNNNINNVNFVCEDATLYIQKATINKEKIDIVLMDPPRSGSTKEFLNSVIQLKPRRIIYISCEPSTLARDLLELQKEYKVEVVQPVDMFPQTFHVESIVLMLRK